MQRQSMKRQALLVAALLVANTLAASTGAASTGAGSAAAKGDEQPAEMAPGADVRLEDALSEQTFSLADFRGRYVVLHFGTSW